METNITPGNTGQQMQPPAKRRVPPLYILAGVVLGLVLGGAAGALVLGMVGRADMDGNASSAAPDLTFQVYEGSSLPKGETKKLSDFQGRPVVLNFWAGLCPPCRAEMPDFQEASIQYGNQVMFLGVDVGPYVGLGSTQDAQKILRDLNISYPTGVALNNDDVVRYNLVGVPSTVFLDAKGNIVKTWTGYIPKDEMAAAIKTLLTPA